MILFDESRFVTLMYFTSSSSRAESAPVTAVLKFAIVVSVVPLPPFAGRVTILEKDCSTHATLRVFIEPLSDPFSVSSSVIVTFSVAIILTL